MVFSSSVALVLRKANFVIGHPFGSKKSALFHIASLAFIFLLILIYILISKQ